MKNAKRLLAVILVLAITVSGIAVNTLTTSASDLDTDLSGGYPEIKSGEVKTVVVEEAGQIVYFAFTPEEDGDYAFYSMAEEDTYGYILDADMNVLATDDDGGTDFNFKVSSWMEAGTTYCLGASYLYDEDMGSFNVSVEKLVQATSMEIDGGDSISGYVGSYGYLGVTFYPENAAEEEVSWSSSNPSAVSVDDWGGLAFLSAGTAVITATSENGLTDSIEVVAQEIPEVTLNVTQQVEIDTVGDSKMFKFTPAETGTYQFRFENEAAVNFTINTELGDWMNNWYIYDSNAVKQMLEAGETYIIVTNFVDYEMTGSYNFTITKSVGISKLEIVSLPTKMDYYEGNDAFEYDGLEVKATLEDGSVVYWSYGSENELAGFYVDIVLHYEGETYQNTTISCGEKTVSFSFNIIENPVASIELVSGTSYTYIENYQGSLDNRYNEETGEYEEFFYYSTYYPDDAVVQINYKDGTSQTANIGDKIDGYWVEWYSNQYDQPWVVGTNNNSIVSYLGATVNLPITVMANPVESIELVSGTSYTCMENCDGYWDNRYNAETGEYEEYFYYHTSSYDVNDVVVKINYKDGTSQTANIGDEIDDGYWVEWSHNQYAQPWVVGTNNQTTISYLGATVNLPITVLENPVESIELVSGTSDKYIENYAGYWDERYNEETGEFEDYFCYYTYYPSDAVIRINYKDGTSQIANVDDYIDGYRVEWSGNQHNQPWKVGTNNQSTISYLGATVNLPITVIENPVESIEVVSGSIPAVIENLDGWKNDYYDDSIGEWVEYFYYNYTVPDDLVVKINYKDGSSVTTRMDESVDDYWVQWDDNQGENPWTLGDDNYVILSYLGATTQVSVSVIENQVDRIEINTAPTREYVYGDITRYADYSLTGELDISGDYWFYPEDLTGLSFTVYYKDGTSKTYTDKDMDGYYIDGHEFELSYDGYNPKPGNFPVTFSYLGKSAEYTVVLKESPVASIEIVKEPTKTNYTDYYYPIFDGMQLKITYTDGTSKIVTVTEENVTYDWDRYFDFHAKIYVDGYLLQIEEYWLKEGSCYFAEYLGQSCKIDGITYTDGKEIASVELDNVSWNGKDMVVNVTYEDGTTETITLDDVILCYGRENEYFDGLGKTENGYLLVYIETDFDENGEVEFYYVYILGEGIEVYPESNVLIGDVNRDGVVNAKDVAALRRYLAGGWNVTIDEAAADVNADGTINAKDVANLRRYLAGGWGVELG